MKFNHDVFFAYMHTKMCDEMKSDFEKFKASPSVMSQTIVGHIKDFLEDSIMFRAVMAECKETGGFDKISDDYKALFKASAQDINVATSYLWRILKAAGKTSYIYWRESLNTYKANRFDNLIFHGTIDSYVWDAIREKTLKNDQSRFESFMFERIYHFVDSCSDYAKRMIYDECCKKYDIDEIKRIAKENNLGVVRETLDVIMVYLWIVLKLDGMMDVNHYFSNGTESVNPEQQEEKTYTPVCQEEKPAKIKVCFE